MDKKELNQDKKKSIGFVIAFPVAMVVVMLFILASSLPSSSPTNNKPIADGTAVIINKKHTEDETTLVGPIINGVIIPIDTPESFVLDFNDSEGSPHLGYVSFETFEEVQVNDEICIYNGVIHELNKCD